ncbi:three-Cys-motif partner protein TcmP [Streptomyces sp. NBC_00647]|uniref:three-Cys-motif partner protein TcmP n=1 Tax=Streptomyces sp. NBC_00647 TaxID=2975796 RepID=UPI0032545F21
MSTGTGGTYWQGKALPSVFKHDLLRRYIPPFGGMTGTQAQDRRVVYLDGYAGEGRYENGEPGSAEIALQVASYYRSRGLNLSCFFVEQQARSFVRLQQVLRGYQARGVDARAHHGEVNDVLDDVVQRAMGVPLFLFLDPCGLCLPMDRLVDVLAQRRPQRRPATELLMNFSMMAVRRLGGHVRSPKGNEKSLERFDAVCGGRWWREYFTGGSAEEDAAEAVAAEYARRLKQRTGMFVHFVPVAKHPTWKPVYYLVFATRSPYGLWVFGDAVARARSEWWKTLELQEEQEEPDALFSTTSILRPDPSVVEKEAVPIIAANLERLLQSGRAVKLVDHTLELFGQYYGQVTEPAARKAVKYLHSEGKTPSTGIGGDKTRELIVQPPTA